MRWVGSALRSVTVLATLTMGIGCTRPQNPIDEVRLHNALKDWNRLFCEVEICQDPLELQDVIEIALQQNLEILLQKHQRELQHEFATSETLKMLPTLTVNGLVSERNNNPASSSQSVGGVVFQSLSTPSTSQEPQQKRVDLELAFGLIDFGLSYYRARQEHNRTRIIEQQQLRLRQNLVQNVIEAYWKTIIAREATLCAKELIAKTEHRQVRLQERTEQGTISKLEGLQSEQDLIEMQIKLRRFTTDYNKARVELAGLMGLPGDACFTLADVELMPLEVRDLDIRELEQTALLCRPELYEKDLEEQVAADEVRAAFLQLFPNVKLFADFVQDNNRFLLHNSWFDAGVRTTWDLLRLPSQYRAYRSTKMQRFLAEDQRLAVSMGIITQVHLAHLTLQDAISQYDLAKDLYRARWKLLEAAKKEEALGAFRLTEIHSLEVEALFGKVNALRTYGQIQVSLERLANALGTPFIFSDMIKQPPKTALTIPGKPRETAMLLEQASKEKERGS